MYHPDYYKGIRKMCSYKRLLPYIAGQMFTSKHKSSVHVQVQETIRVPVGAFDL